MKPACIRTHYWTFVIFSTMFFLLSLSTLLCAPLRTVLCLVDVVVDFSLLFQVLNKPHMLKVRVVRSETAMTDVIREVSLMKMLSHPNIVNLIEVIDDPNSDKFYMVLEYVEGKIVWDKGIGEATCRKYLRDIISGVMYLHSHNIIHSDIKPDNLLVTSTGNVKIGDFSVSQIFEDDDDMLRRSPGTPVFTAPECCQGTIA
ncbi:unnamed protein product [Triticum turgidum subsp. durum]|uniref:Protein kinase domain-containing protein n=1 Tax=Triticum turgidum subsp. durum TaxID=4567 RepID=A0A9R0SGZ3_TRITD|nr:unnamed protein product [Triticum turgidum subsp. durum]